MLSDRTWLPRSKLTSYLTLPLCDELEKLEAATSIHKRLAFTEEVLLRKALSPATKSKTR